jgi:hypothetical protein
MTRYMGIAALVAVTGFSCAPLAAQAGERADPRLRNDCRLATQVLQTGQPAPRREWALEVIRRCDQSGPAALAAFWRSGAPENAAELDQLFNATRSFNDRSVVDAVAEVARRGTATETTRIYAFALLFSYAVPGWYIEIADLLRPRETPARMSAVTHDASARSTRAVLGDLRPEVSAILQSVVEAEPNSRVAGAAETVLRWLRDF